MNKSTCKIFKNDTKKWYFEGKLHREDGPAIEFVNGFKAWYLHGQRHREDGPAVNFLQISYDLNKVCNTKRYNFFLMKLFNKGEKLS